MLVTPLESVDTFSKANKKHRYIGGRVGSALGYGPGSFLTLWTGHIPDSLNRNFPDSAMHGIWGSPSPSLRLEALIFCKTDRTEGSPSTPDGGGVMKGVDVCKTMSGAGRGVSACVFRRLTAYDRGSIAVRHRRTNVWARSRAQET